MRIMNLILLWTFFLVISVCAKSTQATTVETLLADNKLKVNVKLVSKPPLIAKQPVIIWVEILTDRWFGAGNSIQNFDVENMIKLPLNGQAINSSVFKEGKQWASQVREITLFPLSEGIYQIPALSIQVAVNTPSGDIKGVVKSTEFTLDVILPKALSDIDDYIVTDDFTVTSTVQEANDKDDFKIGDAVTLTIEMKAQGVPAMMLPVLPDFSEFQGTGMSIYRKKPQLIEQSNRGELTAQRIEQLNVIFEQSGDYELPDIRFYWWNIRSHSLETILLTRKKWHVTNEVRATEQHNSQRFGQLSVENLQNMLVFMMSTLALLFIVYYFWRNQLTIISVFRHFSAYERRKLQETFIKAIVQENYKQACQHLYALIPYLHEDYGSEYEAISSQKTFETLINFYGRTVKNKRVIEQIIYNAYFDYQTKVSISDAKALFNTGSYLKQKQSAMPLGKIKVNPES